VKRTKAEKRVINSFLEWYESLTPEDRRRFDYVMGAVIKKVMDS